VVGCYAGRGGVAMLEGIFCGCDAEHVLTPASEGIYVPSSSSGSTFLQRGSPPPPPWRLPLERSFYGGSGSLTLVRHPTTVCAPCGGVAQLVRALPCHGRGYGFEPRHSRHFPAGSKSARFNHCQVRKKSQAAGFFNRLPFQSWRSLRGPFAVAIQVFHGCLIAALTGRKETLFCHFKIKG
jgi:hypothetical protein